MPPLLVQDSIVTDQVMPTGLPRVPGHEIVGDVVEVPEDEKRWKVGDRVGSGEPAALFLSARFFQASWLLADALYVLFRLARRPLPEL